MKKVYVITSGDYSDYRIEAIFSTNELAEEFKAALPNLYFNKTEEYELDSPIVYHIKQGHKLWRDRYVLL